MHATRRREDSAIRRLVNWKEFHGMLRERMGERPLHAISMTTETKKKTTVIKL